MRTDTRFGTRLFCIGMLISIGCGDDTSSSIGNANAPFDLSNAEATTATNGSADNENLEEMVEAGGASSDEASEIAPGAQDNTAETALLTFMPLADAGDVVAYVDLDRYLGTWYEIATTPSFQQASCTNTQAEYTFNADEGWVDVVNSCSAGGVDGRPQQIRGRAELVDTETQAKLNVVFFNQRAPYWVVALDGSEGSEPYQWAVVSVPGSQTIWILSRTPQISDAQRQEINAYLQGRSFPIDRLIDTPQVR